MDWNRFFFFSNETYNVQQVHEKMFNITHQQKNANQNHNEITHLTPVCMTIIKKERGRKCRQEYEQKRRLILCRWKCKLVVTMKNSMRIPQKVKIYLLYNPLIPLFGIYSKLKKNIQKRYLYPNVHCNRPYRAINKSMDQENMI